MNSLEQIKQFTKVVADTGDFESMKAFKTIGCDHKSILDFKSCLDPTI